MICSGMNIVRLNMRHGSHDFHSKTISNLKIAEEIIRRNTGFRPNISIALDTRGPEIRTGLIDEVLLLSCPGFDPEIFFRGKINSMLPRFIDGAAA